MVTGLSTKAAAMRADAVAQLGKVPEHLRAGLLRYLDDGIEPGHFLQALLDNNLREAIGRTGAGIELDDLRHLVRMLENDWPADAKGSNGERVAWQKAGGLNGQYCRKELAA